MIIGLDIFIKERKSSAYALLFQRQKIYSFAIRVGPVVANFLPEEKRLDLANKLMYGNYPFGLRLETFIGVQALATITGISVGFILTTFNLPSIIIIVLGAIGFFFPIAVINEKATLRQESIKQDLPAMVGLLSTAVKAGVELSIALELISDNIPNVLGEELRKTMREISTGSQRAKALKKMSDRLGVDILDRFIDSINTAEERGGMNISIILEDFTNDIRIMQRLEMQEKAKKLPTKMLMPITVCIFIPMLILLLVPVGFTVLEAL